MERFAKYTHSGVSRTSEEMTLDTPYFQGEVSFDPKTEFYTISGQNKMMTKFTPFHYKGRDIKKVDSVVKSLCRRDKTPPVHV